MRKLLSILFLFSICSIVKSQNLEFSKVYFFSGTLTSQYDTPAIPVSYGPVHTVPAGKVWKIESAFSGAIGHLGFYLNGIFCKLSPPLIFPIWLDEGDTVQAYILPYAQGVGDYYISILEFTAP